MDITINTEGQFLSITRMASRLWKKRNRLLEDGSDNITINTLSEIEDQFSILIESITNTADKYIPVVEKYAQGKELSDRQVAFLIFLLMGPNYWSILSPAIRDEQSKRYWQICRMTSYIPMDLVEQFVEYLLELQEPFLIDPISEIVMANGLKKYESSLVSGLRSGRDETPNLYVIEALGYLGNHEIETQLVSILKDPSLKESEYLLDKTAICLSMIGNLDGLNYFREAIEGESVSNLDIAKFLGSFGAENDVNFFLERIKKTNNPAWKIKLIEGVGLLGSLIAAPDLLECLSDEDLMVRSAADGSLSLISGNIIEHDPLEDSISDVVEDWTAWWLSNEGSMDKAMRYRDGKPFDIRYWLEKLNGPDLFIRKIAHRALIIYTGQHFPADNYKFMKDQEESFGVWKAWFEENDYFKAGNWYFAGVKIS